MIDADLPLEDIVKEYERSEQSILSKNPILIENTNQQALYTTPTKRQRTNWNWVDFEVISFWIFILEI